MSRAGVMSGSWLAIATLCAFSVAASATQRPEPAASLGEKPLALPDVKDSERCPVSNGSLDVVPPAPHIFGSGAVWFGRGPVFMNLAWKGDRRPAASFTLGPIPMDAGARRAKTPWVAEPAFAGLILIRGRSLRSDHTSLTFGLGGSPSPRLELQAPQGRPSPSDWSFFATSMYVPRTGCYGIQIDTRDTTDIVIFEATP